jgi:antitoxin ParD1/3/4
LAVNGQAHSSRIWLSLVKPGCRQCEGRLGLQAQSLLPLAASVLVTTIDSSPPMQPRQAAWDCASLFARCCPCHKGSGMSTMNSPVPESLKSFVDEPVNSRGFGTGSEYVRELIRKDQERLQLRGWLLAGAISKTAAAADSAYVGTLRDRIGSRTAARQS